MKTIVAALAALVLVCCATDTAKLAARAAPGQSPITPEPWKVSDWYFDDANASGTASDSNDCKSATTACRTWSEIWVHRLGNDLPLPQQLTTFHQLSAQTLNVDPIFGRFQCANGHQVVLDSRAAWATAGADFAAGVLGGGFGFAGAAPTAGGTQMTMAAVPAYVVPKVVLFNVARNSYAFVDTVLAGTASLTQPQTLASLTTTTVIPSATVDNDWVAGDTIRPFVLPLTNLKRWRVDGADLSATSVPCASWVLGADIADSSGNGGSVFPFEGSAANGVISLSIVEPRLNVNATSGRGSNMYALGSYMSSLVILEGSAFATYGGVMKGPTGVGSFQILSGGLVLANNVVIHGTANTGGTITALSAFSDGNLNMFTPGSEITLQGVFFGSYNVTLNPATTCYLAGSTFALRLLTSGNLRLGGNATGTSYAAGVWTDGVALSPANLDANSGLQNPKTGARFCLTQ